LQNTRPARLEKITHLEKPRKSTKTGKDKKKLKKETPRDESPENWVIPSLATAFALPDPLKGSDSFYLFQSLLISLVFLDV
jgi:hypothetical protein